MIPGSLNIPVRRKEEKGKRKLGKSQCRRGTQKPKAVSNPVLNTPKPPSPAHTPSNPPPPAVMTASIPVITNPLLQNLHKDPTQSSPNLSKEGKHTTRKKKNEKVEKDPPKTTIRKKKKDNQSISIDIKTSSENDGPGGSANEMRKKKSHTSSGSKKRRTSSNETKSDGSKEPSDNEEKTAKKFNPEMANNFFKFMKESQRARRRTEDAQLERMPESSQLNYSVRSIRSKMKKEPKKSTSNTEITNFFKPNGDPIWVVDTQPDETMKSVDGVTITNSELVKALVDDNLELEEKCWFDDVDKFIGCNMTRGAQIPEDYQFDSLAPESTLKDLNEYESPQAIQYNTVKNLVELSEDAIKRYALKRAGEDNNRLARTQDVTTVEDGPAAAIPLKVENFQLRTCIVSNISFDLKCNINVKYDRHNAIASIRKLHRKMSMSLEKTAKGGSMEKN